ncbi:MAG: tetratricopeptide repeat protein [Muribaculaceae bacterium]|nr:tetratricopeptide repeat protein [Muribaculaceae bacterium]
MDPEENPEWEDIISKSGIKDKINRLERLQRDGADLMLMGLGRMKQMPFFNKIFNWFIPFTIEHSEIYNTINRNEREMIESVNNLNMFCDSDKYTFALMIHHIPEAQRKQMIEGINAQMEQNREEFKEVLLKSSTPDFDREALSYVRSLYRFYNFFRTKNEFQSPLGFPFNFSSIPFLGTLLREREIIEMVAEFYFRNKHYKEALPLFLIMAEDCNEPSLYEKIGYCYLQEENPQTALSYFEKAELLNDSSTWLCRNIAGAAERAGDYAKAAKYYETLLADDSDNITLLKNYSDCLVKAGKYNDALKVLYKIDYLQPEEEETRTGIVRCLMHLGRYGQAHEMMESVLAVSILTGVEVAADRLILSGHILLATGHIKDAIARYRQAVNAHDSTVKTISQLRKRLDDDWAIYPSDTFDRKIIPLITDAVTLD